MATPARLATIASRFRSSVTNFLAFSWVSSWIAPSGFPSDVASGTHITDRILNSAMLAAGPSDMSLDASSLR